jgi:cobalamin biosynthesis Mg chelatase CobN
MNDQDKAQTAELEASQARAEQNAAELQRHAIAGAALTEAANREVAQANAIDARMTADREAVAAKRIENERAAERRTSAKNRLALYVMTGLVVVILLVGGIYFHFNSQNAVKSDSNVGMNTARP